jgi:lysophospholipase
MFEPFARSALVIALVVGCDAPPKQSAIDVESPAAPVASDFGSEATVVARYDELEAAFDQAEAGTFTGVEGVPLAYRVFRASTEKGAIVFVPGRTEPVRKHTETFLDLVAQGYAVYALDPRGQGASGRMLTNPQIGYVEFFSDYADDLGAFIDDVVRPRGHARVFLLAHSMGGAIALTYAHRQPNAIDGIALSAPMVRIQLATSAIGTGALASVALTSCGLGGTGYAPGQGDFSLDFDDDAAFEENIVTHSRARFDVYVRQLRAHPELALGGVSSRWVCESLLAGAHLEAEPERLTTRTLIFEAGSDQIVDTEATAEYCDAAPGCQSIRYPGAYHEVFSETDDVRNEALARAVRFFDHLAGGAP